jgi:hypothetical protein
LTVRYLIASMDPVKRTPKTLQPQRRGYRIPRVDPPVFNRVLKVINGTVREPSRYEPERSAIRQSLDQIIEYCGRIEAALGGMHQSRTGEKGQRQERPLRTRSERIEAARDIAEGLYAVFTGIRQEFTVFALPRRNLKKIRPLVHKDVSSFIGEAARGFLDTGELEQRRGILPDAEDLFRIRDLFIWPKGDIGVQLCWEFYQGIIQLDDLRRLRRCSNADLHDEPRYFLTKKVPTSGEPRFCSDQCRSDSNYKRLLQRKEEDGRQRPRKTKE